jgi:hypothetical protein
MRHDAVRRQHREEAGGKRRGRSPSGESERRHLGDRCPRQSVRSVTRLLSAATYLKASNIRWNVIGNASKDLVWTSPCAISPD